MWKYDLFAILLIIVVVYYAQQYLVKEGFAMPWDCGDKMKFLSSQETREFLMKDPDSYVSTFSTWDLMARHVNTEMEYRKRIGNAAMSFDNGQKLRLIAAAKRADQCFATITLEKFKGIDDEQRKNIINIPWVFALTRGGAYEEGLPHTRANIIFLSTKVDETPERLAKLLVHEKVHLYQRMYPEHMMQMLQNNGYMRWKQRFGVPRIRANPDLDPYIYIEPKTQAPMLAVYKSDKPTGIEDVEIKHHVKEHPYEEIAYMMDAKYIHEM